MKYTKYTIETTTEAEDYISAALDAAGIEGIEIEDSVPWTKEELDEIFVDEVPVNTNIPEGHALVSFYLEEDKDRDAYLTGVREAIEEMRALTDVDFGTLNIISDDIEDEDYLNSWKQFFHAFEIELANDTTLGIIPSWEEEKTPLGSDIILHIDPGTAFGTGAHETTRLCIIKLSKYLEKGMKVLDLGTGSGILAMTALKLGAGCVRGTELDKNAIPAVAENFDKNGLKDADFELLMGDVVSDEAFRKKTGSGYDLVVANILPVVLTPLTGVMHEMVKSGGLVIYSGILTEKAPDVIRTLEDNNYEILEQQELGEWCVLVSNAP